MSKAHIVCNVWSPSRAHLWGWAVSTFPDDAEKLVGYAGLMGASLDFLVASLRAVELQLTYELMLEPSADTRTLLYLYFSLKEEDDHRETVSRLIEVFRTVRTSLEAERPKLELHAADPALAGKTTTGYVPKSPFGPYGHIHLAFSSIVPSQLSFGAPNFVNLLLHEATHKYCKTVDVAYTPYRSMEGGALHAWRTKYASQSHQKRRQLIAPGATGMTNKAALTNADSFSWFYAGMVNEADRTLSTALSLVAPGSHPSLRDELRACARSFEAWQKQWFDDEHPVQPRVFTID